MHNANLKERLAEWILALVTTPERASATVGDLLEMSSGVVRFWASVLATAASIAWREAWAHPRQTTWLAVRGTLYSFLWIFAGLFTVFVATFVLGYLAGLSPARIDSFSANWSKTIAFLFGNVWIPFLVGRWIARKAPGREMPVCLATMILQTVLGVCISALVAQLNHTLDFKPLLADLSLSIVGAFPYFAFTAWAMQRRRRIYA
jgi:hypothetical protein